MGKGGGGGLAFLNKKSWHPGGFKQQEDVWKREQAKAQEEKRLEELKKQIAEEREAQELLRVAQEAGHATKTERLEFMYKGGGSAMLEGPAMSALPPPAAPAPAVPLPAALAAPALTAAASAVAVYVDDTPKARNEAWARLHGDPMLMIKQQEQSSLKSIRANPVKMDSIVREVEALKAARRAKKEAKHAKKEAKRERKHSHHDDEGHRGDAARGGANAAARSERRRSRSPRARSPRNASPPRRRSRSSSRERRRSREREHRRSRSRSREHRRSRSRSRERRRSRSPERKASRERRRHDSEPRHAQPAEAADAWHARPAAADGACAQKGVAAYGLTFASAEAEEAARAKAEARGAAGVYEPAVKAAAPEPPPTWARGRNNAGHRAGKLTDEERAARLAAMSTDAELHEDERWQRLRCEAAREAADASMEQHAPAHHHTEKPSFLGEKERELFGGSDGGPGGMSMAERVGARKHFQQRGSDAAGDGFRR